METPQEYVSSAINGINDCYNGKATKNTAEKLEAGIKFCNDLVKDSESIEQDYVERRTETSHPTIDPLLRIYSRDLTVGDANVLITNLANEAKEQSKSLCQLIDNINNKGKISQARLARQKEFFNKVQSYYTSGSYLLG